MENKIDSQLQNTINYTNKLKKNFRNKTKDFDFIVNVFLDSLDAQAYKLKQHFNSITNPYGVFYLNSIQFNLKTIEKEIREIEWHDLPKTKKVTFRRILEGFSEIHSEQLNLDECKLLEHQVSTLPAFQQLKKHLLGENIKVEIEFIDSRDNPIFKGLYVKCIKQ